MHFVESVKVFRMRFPGGLKTSLIFTWIFQQGVLILDDGKGCRNFNQTTIQVISPWTQLPSNACRQARSVSEAPKRRRFPCEGGLGGLEGGSFHPDPGSFGGGEILHFFDDFFGL